MSQSIISAVASELRGDPFQTPAPSGYIWKKDSDKYDFTIGVILEGSWVLVPQQQQQLCTSKTSSKIESDSCNCGSPNAHMSDHFCYKGTGGFQTYLKKCKMMLIKEQRETVSKTFHHDYHVCNHKNHDVCTGSPCCDLFWHDGQCCFISEDGECGYAVRFGST